MRIPPGKESSDGWNSLEFHRRLEPGMTCCKRHEFATDPQASRQDHIAGLSWTQNPSTHRAARPETGPTLGAAAGRLRLKPTAPPTQHTRQRHVDYRVSPGVPAG